MTQRTQIYIGLVAAALLATAILGGSVWSNHKITRLERSAEEAKQIGDQKEQQAAAKELEAAGYRQKIDYLERQLSETQIAKRKQDEKLEKLNTNSRNARGDVERAKRTRTIDAAGNELCAKLAQLAHPCE